MKQLPIFALIAANVIPLIGVLFFAWDAKVVMILYWLENLIIGVFNVIKMLSLGVLNKKMEPFFLSLFFIIHYGAFCSVHGILLTDILSIKVAENTGSSDSFLSIYQDIGIILKSLLANYGKVLWLGLAGIVMNQLINFIEYFILRGEIFTSTANNLMSAPYKKIVVMHIGLIIGSIILARLESPIWLLATLVILKMLFEYNSHKQEKRKSAAKQQIKNI